MGSFRSIMVLMTHYDLELHQMDVKMAFLNGDLYEKRLHDTTQNVLSWMKRTYGMPPLKIHLWIKSKSLDNSI